MVLREISFIIIACILLSSVIIGLMSTKVLDLPNDNAIEQAAEAVIESQTGLSVDLSPEENSVSTPK